MTRGSSRRDAVMRDARLHRQKRKKMEISVERNGKLGKTKDNKERKRQFEFKSTFINVS